MVISHISVVKINLTLLLKTLKPNTTNSNFIMDLWIISPIELMMLVRCSYKKSSIVIVIIDL